MTALQSHSCFEHLYSCSRASVPSCRICINPNLLQKWYDFVQGPIFPLLLRLTGARNLCLVITGATWKWRRGQKAARGRQNATAAFAPKAERLSLYCTKAASFLGSPGLWSPSTAIAVEGHTKQRKALIGHHVYHSLWENYLSHSWVYWGGCEKLWMRSIAVGFASPSLFLERGIPSTAAYRRRGRAVTVLTALSPGSWCVSKTSSIDCSQSLATIS